MPINEYMSPNINQHQNTHVDTYEPINFQFLNGQLEKKQAAYDAGELLAHNITDNIKINPLIQPHAEEAQRIKDSYRSEIDSVLQESGGNYAVATPKLQQIGRRLADDLQYGNIAKINNTTNEYNTKKKAIEEWGIKHNKNVDQQLTHLNYQTFGNYAQDPEKYKRTLKAYDYGAPVDTNAVIKEGLGFMKDSGWANVDVSDPNWITKVKTKYSNPDLKKSLQNYLITQPGIKYNVMLENPNLTDPSQVTDEQAKAYVDKMILGPTQAATFKEIDVDKNQTGQGRRAGELAAEEQANPNTSINQEFNYINPNGKTTTELKDNYNNINSNTLATINRTLDYNGLSKVSYVGPDGKEVVVNAAQIASDKNAQQAIKDGKFKAYDKNSKPMLLGDGIKNGIVSTLTKQFNTNDAITNDISSSVSEAVDDLIPGNKGITIPNMAPNSSSKHLKGGYITNDQLKKLALQKYTGKKQMDDLYFNDAGHLMKKVNGEEIAVGTSPEFNKIFHSVIGDPEITKQSDIKLAARTNKKSVVTFSEVPENSLGVDTKPYYKSVDKTIGDNLESLSWKVPGDPTNGTDVPLNEALAKSLGVSPEAVKGYKLVTSTGKSSDPVISHSTADVNGMDLSRVNFKVDLGDGIEKNVVLNVDKNNQVNSGVLNMQKADPSYKADRFIKSITSTTSVNLPSSNGVFPITINPNGTILAPTKDGDKLFSAQEFFALPGTLGMLNAYINSTHR